ncbi:unnamed protein product [Nyctereutes procyonoides]|uniref:(raccoon dog) hypothetical protein n=1 Tax=Nyctereutes procyonoides TaxID=34880 RepID=A0A811ZUE9_NYCPR|nr:unnamed protein product [Nyctereutes procyonoides]
MCFGIMVEKYPILQQRRKKIPLVPENLKKRKASQALKATQAKQTLLDKKEVDLRQLEMKPCGLEVPDKHSLAFVRTIAGLCLQIFSRVFFRVTPQTMKTLRISVRDLILKCGQAKVKNNSIPLTDNTTIHEIAFLGNSAFLRLSISQCPIMSPRIEWAFLKEVGLPGYQGECINQLIQQLN